MVQTSADTESRVTERFLTLSADSARVLCLVARWTCVRIVPKCATATMCSPNREAVVRSTKSLTRRDTSVQSSPPGGAWLPGSEKNFLERDGCSRDIRLNGFPSQLPKLISRSSGASGSRLRPWATASAVLLARERSEEMTTAPSGRKLDRRLNSETSDRSAGISVQPASTSALVGPCRTHHHVVLTSKPEDAPSEPRECRR